MKQYVEKERMKKIVRAALKSTPQEDMERVLIEKIDTAKPSAVYPLFPGVKLGFINPVTDEQKQLRYEESVVVCIYSCDKEIYVRTDDGDEYTYSEIMENTDLIRTNESRIVTEDPFITTQNLARRIKEIVDFYNAYNERADGKPDCDSSDDDDNDEYIDDDEENADTISEEK